MDEYKLHPKDNDFIDSLYNSNINNTTNIYSLLYNTIKRRSVKSLLDLLLNIVNKVDNDMCIQIFNNIISFFGYDNYTRYNIELKLIASDDIRQLINNNNRSINYLLNYSNNKTLSYYEILIYSQTKYIRDISDTVKLEHIYDMTDRYINQLHSIEYSDISIIENKIFFPIYHINYINTRDDIDFNDINYHLLYLNSLKFINKFITGNINRDITKLLLSNIHQTAIFISKILKSWNNKFMMDNNNVISLDENIYLEYQNDIILFLSLCNHNNLDLYFDNDYPDELIECFSLFQTNYHKLISDNSLLNIHTKCRIIELNHNNTAWNNTDNINELLKFYITLEKYNNSTGFDSREKTRFFIAKILVTTITEYSDVINTIASNQLLLYKFVILLLNDNYKNIAFFKNYAIYYDETKINLLDSIQVEYHSISMLFITRMIIILSNYLTDKWLDYMIYEIVLWWNSNINLFTDEDVQFMILDIINTDDDMLFTSKKNLDEFFKSFIYTSNELWSNSIILNKWKQYFVYDRNSINEFNRFIDNDVNSISSPVLMNTTNYTTFKNKLTYFADISNNNNDIPAEFIDPLMCELIESPIVLPLSNVIVDEKVIFKHIVFKGDNPFNRMPLTIDELIKYQDNEVVKDMIKKWKDKYDEWIGQHTF
jgi:hypothetical protein